MATIEDRAIAWSEQHRDIYMCNADVIAEVSYKQGAEDQRKMDHSQEHLLWIVNEYGRWCYEQWHCDVNEKCTFEQWINDKMALYSTKTD